MMLPVERRVPFTPVLPVESVVAERAEVEALPVRSVVPVTFRLAKVAPVEADICVVDAVVPVSFPTMSRVPLIPVLPLDNVVAERAVVDAVPMVAAVNVAPAPEIPVVEA